MADNNLTPEEQRELNRLKAEGNRFSAQEAKNSGAALDYTREINQMLRENLGIRRGLTNEERTLRDLGNEVVEAVRTNVIELGNAEKIEKEMSNRRKTQLGIMQEMDSIQKGLSDIELSAASELSKLYQEKADIFNQLDTLEKQQLDYQKGLLSMTEDEAKVLNNILTDKYHQADIVQDYIRDITTEISKLGELSEQEINRLSTLDQLNKAHDEVILKLIEENDIQREINNRMGVSGAVVEGIGGIMQRLGMRSGIFNDAMKDAHATMHDMAEEAIRTDKYISKTTIAAAGLKEVMKGAFKAMDDPAFVILKFAELNQGQVRYQRLTGQNAAIQAAHNGSLATGVELLELMLEYTNKTGLSAQAVFSREDLGRMAEAQNLLGLTAEQAGVLGLNAKISGTSIQEYKEGIVESVNSFNKANNSAVAHGKILQDVLSISEDISLSLGGDAGRIAKAAAAARKMGLELAKVDSIAEGLLDFESSIQSELEAQLLTGRSINLSKARELALNNDLEGVAKELAANGASAAEFAAMNRIQQQGLARALGMNRQELGKMLVAQAAQGDLTKEQRAQMQGVTLEQLEQMEAAESLKKAFSKLAEPIASLVTAITPFVTLVVKGVAAIAPFAGYVYVGFKALKILNSGILSTITSMLKLTSLQQAYNTLTGKGAEAAGGLAAKVKSTVQQKGKELLQQKAEDTGSSLADKAKGRVVGGEESLPASSKLTQSISKINATALLKGAAAMAVAAGSIFIFAKAAQELEEVEDYGRVAVGLGLFAGSMALTGYILSLATPAILAAVPAMLAFSGSLLAFGAAIAIATPGIKAFTGLAEVMTPKVGLGFILTAAGIAGLAFSLTSLGASALFAVPALGILGSLALMGPGILQTGDGFIRMAEGVGNLANALNRLDTKKLEEIKDVISMGAFTAPLLEATGAITNLIGNITGNQESESSKKAMMDKLDEVVRAISNIKGNVYIDGEDAGNIIWRNTVS